MYQSWSSNRVAIGGVEYPEAKGLALRVPMPQALDDMRDLVDEMILVGEEQIDMATHYALKPAGLILARRSPLEKENTQGETTGINYAAYFSQMSLSSWFR